MSFIFYDTETTGIETYYDQILQFAAIVTDDELNEQDSIDVRCRRLPWVVPAPGALLVTGVTPQMIEGENRSHYDMIGEIEAWLRDKGPSTFFGYNSVRFDETLLRQALYQTLRPVYLTNTEGNTRGDVMVIAQAVSAYAPDAIDIPVDSRGRTVFRLGDVARENGINLTEEDAHDALADVRATMNLARFMRDGAPEVWGQMVRNTQKSYLAGFLEENDVFNQTFFFFNKPYTYVMTKAAINLTNNSEYAVFDLNEDPNDYLDLDVDALLDVLNQSPKVIRTTRINSQPIIMPFDMEPDEMRGERLPLEVYQERAAAIRDNAQFQQRLGEAMVRRYEDVETSPYVEGRIYDGFAPPQDQTLMNQFHGRPWEERLEICDQLQDERFVELGRRLIYAERPDVLPDDIRHEIQNAMSQRVSSEEDVPWTTVQKALQEANDLKRREPDQTEELDAIIEFLTGLGDQAAGA